MNGAPPGAVSSIHIVSPTAQQAYNHISGEGGSGSYQVGHTVQLKNGQVVTIKSINRDGTFTFELGKASLSDIVGPANPVLQLPTLLRSEIQVELRPLVRHRGAAQTGNNPPMSPELQAAYQRGQHVPTAADNEQPGVLEGVATGFAKGAAETIHTAGQFLHDQSRYSYAEEVLNTKLEGGTDSKSRAEAAGKFGEAVAEFVLADNAVKSLGLAERLGLAQKVVKISAEHPIVGKAIAIGFNALRTGAVGGGQALAMAQLQVRKPAGTGIVTGLTGGAIEGAAVLLKGFSHRALKKSLGRRFRFAPQKVQRLRARLNMEPTRAIYKNLMSDRPNLLYAERLLMSLPKLVEKQPGIQLQRLIHLGWATRPRAKAEDRLSVCISEAG